MPATETMLFPNGGVSNVPGRKTLVLEVVYGASGPASAKGKGFQLVNDTGTGKITVTFDRTYRHLVHMGWGWKVAAAGAVLTPVVLTNNISTDGGIGGGTLVIETRASAGTATDPSTGDKLTLKFDVSIDALSDDGAVTVS